MAKKDTGKVVAVISYITWIGWIIAFLLNMQEKDKFAAYHLRQSLLILLIWIVGWIIFWIPIIGWLLAIAMIILWFFGLIYAIQGEKKEIPFIGKYAQQWFKFI